MKLNHDIILTNIAMQLFQDARKSRLEMTVQHEPCLTNNSPEHDLT